MEESMISGNGHDQKSSCDGAVSIGCYLGARLKSIGITHFFTVPGDYTLNLLDEIISVEGLSVVSCCNELNAGYAADGYARASGLMGVVVTTYMVGALSTINAVAGAFAENLPVLVVVGSPSSHEYRTVHHSINDLDRSICRNAFQPVVHDTFAVTNQSNAQARVDAAISSCVRHRKPVYLEIPCNVATEKVNGVMPIGSLSGIRGGGSDATSLQTMLETVIPHLVRSKKMIVMVGSNVISCEAVKELKQLIDHLQCASVHFADAKGILDESSENFMGCYWSSISIPPIQDLIDDADFLLVVGPYFSDYINVGWSMNFPPHKTMMVAGDHVHFNGHRFSFLKMTDVLSQLRTRSPVKGNPFKDTYNAIKSSYFSRERKFEDLLHPLDLAFFIPEVQSFVNHIGKQQSIGVVAETGDCWFIGQKLQLPSHGSFFVQLQYGSIGWSLPASLGMGLALEKQCDSQGQYRLLLLIGDGSFRVSAQALSTMIEHNLNITIFLMNNQSYAIEDQIHQGVYNQLSNWQYADIVRVLSGGSSSCKGVKVDNRDGLRQAIYDAVDFVGVYLIECMIDKIDCTEELRKWGESVAETNAK